MYEMVCCNNNERMTMVIEGAGAFTSMRAAWVSCSNSTAGEASDQSSGCKDDVDDGVFVLRF